MSAGGRFCAQGRGRKKGSECVLGRQACGGILINMGHWSTKVWRGPVASHDHTASKRQSETLTQDQHGPQPMVSYSSVSQT